MSKLLKQLKQQLEEKDKALEEKDKEIANLNFALRVEKDYYTNSYKQNERLKDKLGTITTYNQELLRALDLMRKYMFNVMCADDVPSVDYFIKQAQEGVKDE